MLTRSLNNTTLFFMLAVIFTAPRCTTSSQPHGNESEAEEEIPGDDPCPPEGCTTDIICSANRPCPDDDPCKIYRCNTASATCVWNILDQDGDRFAPRGCDGRDCNDSAECQTYLYEGEPVDRLCGDFIHPGAREFCNGEDEDCDGEVDEEIENQPCGPPSTGSCQSGTQSCRDGHWSECQGGVYPTAEICDGLDNDCDGHVDRMDEPCTGNGACSGIHTCIDGEWTSCSLVKPRPEDCHSSDDLDCDGLAGCADIEDCRGQECQEKCEDGSPNYGSCAGEGYCVTPGGC